ncbi:AmmeMemoRadiSam system protein A [Ferrimonas pelagia]|uniref:AMMECR1 domain-containing protein n=1 Tax=Ferrimonas pelagia TaxID=1177826 RepID=A0ABP9FL85_9GAMM
MPHSSCNDTPSPAEQQRWLAWVRQSIAAQWGQTAQPPSLQWGDRITDAFVSLHKGGALRGCMGVTGNQTQPLTALLSHLAQQTAFADPRFAPLAQAELDDCQIEIHILGPKHAIAANSRAQLLHYLQAGQGLQLRQGGRSALFLPVVWHQLPDKNDFVDALLRKGGWRADHWPDAMDARTFSAFEVHGDAVPSAEATDLRQQKK